jgi:histidinol-phosphatase (PHP family)
MRVDYHVHVAAHGEYSYMQEWIDQYLDWAWHRGIREIGFNEHDEFSALVDLELIKKIQAEKPHGISVKLGIEVDYIPGREEKIQQIVSQAEYDYVIGSVHFIEGWGFDHPDFRGGFSERDIDHVYSQYAALLLSMVQTPGLDVVGHIDLVKIWGHRPGKHTALHYFETVLKAIQKIGLAVEINCAGLRKEVAELYPAADILARMFSYDIPITIGSDAHHPEQIGEGLEAAYRAARQAGYRYLVRFDQHQQLITPLEY